MALPQTQAQNYLTTCNSPSAYTPKGERADPDRHVYTHVIALFTTQKVESSPWFHQQMTGQTKHGTYNGLLLGLRKERSFDTCYNK